MKIGIHTPPKSARAKAEAVGAECLQLFLSNPRAFRGSTSNIDPSDFHGFPTFIHAPYVINITSQAEWIARNSIKLLMATSLGATALEAKGVVFHGGNWKGANFQDGLEGWRALTEQEFQTKILIENSAYSKGASTDSLQRWERLWSVVSNNPQIGVCLDLAHTWAAGWTPSDVGHFVDIVGKVDLIHMNGAGSEWKSERDRHHPFVGSESPPKYILACVKEANSDFAICETRDPEGDLETIQNWRDQGLLV